MGGAEELVRWFAGHERPRADWKVGLEHEKIPLLAGTIDPVPYEGPRGIGAALQGFSRFGYQPFLEDGRVIATQSTGLTVSIEPGGRFMLVAHQGSDSIAVFRLEAASGRPEPTGTVLKVQKPVCVLPVPTAR